MAEVCAPAFAPVRHEAQPRRQPVSAAVGLRLAALLEEAPHWTTATQRARGGGLQG